MINGVRANSSFDPNGSGNHSSQSANTPTQRRSANVAGMDTFYGVAC
ncbi:MAG: hypothetical protein JWO56_2265 [Acidobacteria bacterium]|nr:hypothetical protein [Acidobacteriota bacterium]